MYSILEFVDQFFHMNKNSTMGPSHDCRRFVLDAENWRQMVSYVVLSPTCVAGGSPGAFLRLWFVK